MPDELHLPPGKDGNGLLLYEERYIGSVSDASRRIFARTYQYDTDLRPAGHSTSINPEGAIVDPDSGAAVYQTDIQNDPYFSRPVSVTWPYSGTPEVRTYTKYDINGYVTEEGHSADYDIAERFLRKVDVLTPTGQVIKETFGNDTEQLYSYYPSTWQMGAVLASSSGSVQEVVTLRAGDWVWVGGSDYLQKAYDAIRY